MKKYKRIIVSVMWVIIGAVLIYLAFAGKVDAFWNGMGSGLLVVGIIQLLRFYRFHKNADYREKMELEKNDERHVFLRGRAWAWTGYLFVIISAISSIVFRIVKQNLLSMAASGSVCLILILYWVSYIILKRKY